MVSIRGFVYRRVCRFGRRYGFGILMSEVLTRRRPFASMSSSKPVFMVQEIIRGKRPGLPDIDDDLTLLAAGPKGTPCVHLRRMLALRCLTPPPPHLPPRTGFVDVPLSDAQMEIGDPPAFIPEDPGPSVVRSLSHLARRCWAIDAGGCPVQRVDSRTVSSTSPVSPFFVVRRGTPAR